MINLETLYALVEQKLITVQKHPDTEFYIYNYSPLVQYQRLWNDTTLMTNSKPFKIET